MAPEHQRGLRRFDRSTMLAELADRRFDLVVVGAGLAGSGVALDAASRGLRTALVERDDFAAGTSSHSSKLVHGGLRHLRRGDLHLVATAFAERRRLLHNAAHLIEPLPFVIPSDGIDARFVRTVDAMLWAYDIAEGRRRRDHRRVDATELDAHLPVLREVDGGFILDNAVIDDARLVLALARTAGLDHVATVVNRTTVAGTDRDGAGRIRSVRVHTSEGDEFDVATRAVVDATGAELDVEPVVHVALPATVLPLDAATVLAADPPLVAVPWGDVVLVGPVPTEGASLATVVDAILGRVAAVTTVSPVAGDVVSVSSGMRARHRPSRRHAVVRGEPGVVRVSGASLTTYRQLAADTVDAVIEQFADDLDRWVVRRCRTADLPLRGATGHGDVATSGELGATVTRRLVRRHGAEAGAVTAMTRGFGTDPLGPGLTALAAEIAYAARYEMATTVADVLERRTRSRMVDLVATAAAVDRTAEILGAELGWSAADTAQAAATYRADLDKDLAALAVPVSS